MDLLCFCVRIRMLGGMHACALCLCYSHMRNSCELRFCASIMYEARVTVCLCTHVRLCVAYVCQVSASVYANTCGALVCASFCLWYAYERGMRCICDDAIFVCAVRGCMLGGENSV